jgi:hypothetical protein
MNAIGGYFELELRQGTEYHPQAIHLNLGRSGFEYILKAKSVKKIFLPYYTCSVMLDPLKRTNIPYEFYHIGYNLEPSFDYKTMEKQDYFLYTNYFGIKDSFVKKLSSMVKNLIVDNAQSFYSKPIWGVDTFYSPRKFFGLPDGGYLYTDQVLTDEFEHDDSTDRFKHLIGRVEKGPEAAYQFFKKNEAALSGQGMKTMSAITKKLLQGIDYEGAAEARRRNFNFLHENLHELNLLDIHLESASFPMVYPFFYRSEKLRVSLIENKVYTACYWPNVLDWCEKGTFERDLAEFLVPLPVDQRYNVNEMREMLNMVKEYIQ